LDRSQHKVSRALKEAPGCSQVDRMHKDEVLLGRLDKKAVGIWELRNCIEDMLNQKDALASIEAP